MAPRRRRDCRILSPRADRPHPEIFASERDLHGPAAVRDNRPMGLLSDLVAQGRIRNRDDLRRVYRRLVKKLHPDSAIARFPKSEVGGSDGMLGTSPRVFVDFSELRKELEEAERLLAELETPGKIPPTVGAPRPGLAGSDMPKKTEPKAAKNRDDVPARVFDRDLLIGELRDLVARGFPVHARALARNKAYRDCVATVSAQLALLTGDKDAFARADADMRIVRASSLRFVYHVMQVLWNGLDWGVMGMAWSRHAALRDYAVIRDELESLGLRSLDSLLSWIIEADSIPDFGGRAGVSKR